MNEFEREGEAFQRALDEARRGEAALDAFDQPAPVPNLVACVELARTPGGGDARWRQAMDWTREPAMRIAPAAPTGQSEPELCSFEMAEAIALELGFRADLTQRQLRSHWRDFLWRNHPDRLPAHDRARANLRVAVANALYDRALRQRTKSR